jgi:hypothetical protein
MLDGRAREMGLGSAADFTLKEARERARRYRQMLKGDGTDPIDARQEVRAARRAAAAKSMTFRQCAVAYIAGHASRLPPLQPVCETAPTGQGLGQVLPLASCGRCTGRSWRV